MSFLTGVEIDIDVANIVFVHGGTELRPRPVARARFETCVCWKVVSAVVIVSSRRTTRQSWPASETSSRVLSPSSSP